MNTDETAIKEILAEYLDSDLSGIKNEMRLCDLGLDEVDIEILWLTIEDELGLSIEDEPETTCDTTASNPDFTPLESFSPITPDETVGDLITFFKKQQ